MMAIARIAVLQHESWRSYAPHIQTRGSYSGHITLESFTRRTTQVTLRAAQCGLRDTGYKARALRS
jgi:hypothetical protein